jgi:hypothetical protein
MKLNRLDKLDLVESWERIDGLVCKELYLEIPEDDELCRDRSRRRLSPVRRKGDMGSSSAGPYSCNSSGSCGCGDRSPLLVSIEMDGKRL